MPTYTLYYFNGRGRAEICRMLLAAGEVKYNDRRIEVNEWDTYKGRTYKMQFSFESGIKNQNFSF